MRKILSIKMLFRSPIKTIVTLLLLTSISFMLLSRVYEYAVTAREYKSIENTYQGIGTIEVSPPEKIEVDGPMFLTSYHYNPDSPDGTWEDTRYQGLPEEAMTRIATLPYVTAVDTRYMTAGISDTYYRLDDRKTYYNYTHTMILEGTLKSWNTRSLLDLDESTAKYFSRMTFADFDHIKPLNDVTGMGWNPLNPDDVIQVSFVSNYRGEYPEGLDPDDIKSDQEGWDDIWIASGNNSRADYITNPAEVSSDVVDGLTEGERYVLVVNSQGSGNGKIDMSCAGGTACYWIDSLVVPIPQNDSNYLETEVFSDIRNLIEMTNADAHTLDVVYCGDMSAISSFANKYSTITEGRALTFADSGSEVCVINSVLAKEYGLSVGDKLSLGLCDTLSEQHAGLGAVNAGVRGRYSEPVRDASLEIVGIYADLTSGVYQGNNPHWFYSSNTIFVPTSLLPIGEKERAGHTVKPGEFSFIIRNIRDVKPFLAEYGTMIEKEMGLKLTISDGGWSVIEKEFTLMEQSSVLSISVLILAMIVAVVFVVYLFIIRQRKEYAIMRATGCTKRRANMSVFLPLLLMDAVAVAFGGVGASIYSTYSIMKTPIMKAAVSQAAVFDTSIPPVITAVSLLGIVAFLCVAEWIGLTVVGHMPPLMLLQGSGQRKQQKKLIIPDSGAVADLSTFQPDKIIPVPAIRNYSGLSHVLAYLFRNIKRLKMKSCLTVIAAAVLIAALGQFIMAWQSTRVLYETFPIKLTFFDGISVYTASQIKQASPVKDPYVEFVGGVAEADQHPALLRAVPGQQGMGIQLAVTNDVNRYYGQPISIEYLPRYGEELWTEHGNDTPLVCVMFGSEMDKLGVALGDKIEITRHTPATLTNIFRIVGRASLTNNGKEPNILFLPPGAPHTRMFPNVDKEDILHYSFVEYSVTDNNEIDTLRQKLKSFGIAEKQFLMDTESLDKIKENLKIFELLFPVVAGVLILIGGLLSGLMVLQSAKEAALLRAIGTTKVRTQIMLAGQQFVLCAAGLILGVILISLYNGAERMTAMGSLFIGCALLFGLCYVVSTAVCSWVVTRQEVIALLQTRE
ncbi:MAG: transporter permease subunit [Herbinix sp.]|jgi:ABC-type antimicrobial peptide transport system permease subunit|nr:transporter permease subunit [Herbinix sp.]